jgi:hypothetical protein
MPRFLKQPHYHDEDTQGPYQGEEKIAHPLSRLKPFSS